MADDTQPPTPPAPTFWQGVKAVLLTPAVTHALVALLATVVGGILTHYGVAPKTVETVTEIIHEIPAPAPAALDEFPATGWQRDEQVIAENLDPAKTLQFAQTPAGRAAQGDDDVFLYRAVRKAAGKPAPWYPNVNQLSVGCCVGCGSKHGIDVVQATAIASGARFEWKPASVETVYATSRIDIGKGQIRGDGSVGRWACEAAKLGALAPMEKIGQYDLTVFDPMRARAWGSSGVPAEVKAVAREHPVKGAALVTSAADVKRALQQGYPVVVCSDVGFNNPNGSVGSRDAQGFIRPRGTWPHCMCLLAWRNGDRPGALCLNSWGDKAHAGPVWPEDMPVAAFWIDEAVVDRMVRQGDSFALSDVQGFPSRKLPLDWNIRVIPRRPLDLFAREQGYALAW